MTRRKILLVEDDATLRDSLGEMLQGSGFAVIGFATGESVLQHIRDQAGFVCGNAMVIIDVRLGGVSGIDVQQAVRAMGSRLPFVFISGYHNVHDVNEAWRGGALNFLFKPFTTEELLQVIEQAFIADRMAISLSAGAATPETREKFGQLSPRQKEVLRLVASGLSNTAISARMGISPRTVKMHRENMMHRLGFKHVTDLVRFNDACKSLF